MASMLQNLRLLADPSRIRILLLVTREELSVAELQEILAVGQDWSRMVCAGQWARRGDEEGSCGPLGRGVTKGRG